MRIPGGMLTGHLVVGVVASLIWPGQSTFGGPVLDVDTSAIHGKRLCSQSFVFRVPVANSGDEPLEFGKIRATCSACMNASVSKHRLRPGERGTLLLSGRRVKLGPFALACFVHSNDTRSPVKKVSLDLTRIEGYACDVSWEGGKRSLEFPYEDLALDPIPATTENGLRLTLTTLGDAKLESVLAASQHFDLVGTEIAGTTAHMALRTRLLGAGFHLAIVELTVNDRDLLFLPLHLAVSSGVRPGEGEVSFGSIPVGRRTQVEFRAGVAGEEGTWEEIELMVPPEAKRALSLRSHRVEGKQLVVSLEVDSRMLVGKGAKSFAVKVMGAHGQVSFRVEGYVY